MGKRRNEGISEEQKGDGGGKKGEGGERERRKEEDNNQKEVVLEGDKGPEQAVQFAPGWIHQGLAAHAAR